MCPLPDSDLEGEVLTENRTDVEKPKLYRVLLHNDDFTTMDFVVYILQNVFRKTEVEAVTIMMKIHLEGFGIAGIYPFEIANAKATKVLMLSRNRGFPLLATVEEE
jgi:ATP-dependent Clp protease adaptor protein ClpS